MNYVINLCHLQNNEGFQSFQIVLLQHQAEFQNFFQSLRKSGTKGQKIVSSKKCLKAPVLLLVFLH